MKDALLRRGDFNVVIVNWAAGNGPPYSQAAANTRLVGAQIAQVIHQLIVSIHSFIRFVYLTFFPSFLSFVLCFVYRSMAACVGVCGNGRAEHQDSMSNIEIA